MVRIKKRACGKKDRQRHIAFAELDKCEIEELKMLNVPVNEPKSQQGDSVQVVKKSYLQIAKNNIMSLFAKAEEKKQTDETFIDAKTSEPVPFSLCHPVDIARDLFIMNYVQDMEELEGKILERKTQAIEDLKVFFDYSVGAYGGKPLNEDDDIRLETQDGKLRFEITKRKSFVPNENVVAARKLFIEMQEKHGKNDDDYTRKVKLDSFPEKPTLAQLRAIRDQTCPYDEQKQIAYLIGKGIDRKKAGAEIRIMKRSSVKKRFLVHKTKN